MASLTDRWTRPGENKKRVKSARHGKGLRWLVEWVEPDGQKRRKSFGNKDAAQAHKARMEVELNEDRYINPTKRAVTYAEMWPTLETIKSTRSRKTIEAYWLPWNGYIRERWGETSIKDTSPVQLQLWLTSLRKKDGEPLSVSLEKKIIIVMKSLANLAVDEEYIAKNPIAKVKSRDALVSGRRYLSVDELDKLLTALGPHSIVAEVLVLTGIRKGEAFGLQVRDLDVRRKRLRIERDVDDRGEVDTTKSGRHRDVPIRGELLEQLKRIAKGRARTDWLLPSPSGGPWTRDRWKPVWERARTTAGLGDYDTHELRHTAVSFAIQSGANVKAVQRMVGHASAAMTLDVYGHLWDEELDTVAEKMAELMAAERAKGKIG